MTVIQVYRHLPTVLSLFRILGISLLFLFLLCNDSYAQTTIVAVRNNTEVVLAADSKGTRADNRRHAAAAAAPVCKIYACANFFVGLAGVREATINNLNFSVPPLLGEACRAARDPQAKLAAFERLLVPRLTRLLLEVRRRDAANYRNLVETGTVVSVIMVGFESSRESNQENSLPFILARNFHAPVNLRDPIVVRVTGNNQVGELTAGSLAYSFGGHHEQITELVKTRRDLWHRGLVEAAQHLVEVMIDYRPDVVGAPIDVLRIERRSGATWIQRKSGCDGTQFKQLKSLSQPRTPSFGVKRDVDECYYAAS